MRRPALLLLALSCVAWSPLRRSVGAVEEGNDKLAKGDAEGALEAYRRAAEEVPSSPELHYDLGLAHLAKGEHDDAVAELRQAVATPDRALRGHALRALGHAQAGREAWEEAADAFKRALLLRPDDEDARHDYEVAWLKLHPPCEAKEDAYEDNDRPEDAKPLDPKVSGPLTACPGDADWFALDVQEGHSLFVTVRTETEGAALDVELRGPEGAVLREARSTEGEGTARIDLRLADRAGIYRVGVSEAGETETGYTFEVAALPPCPAGDDGLEDNDGPADARPLELGQQALRSCPGDEDWFAVTVADGKDLAVSIEYDPPRGTLGLDLVDAGGSAVVKASHTGSGKEQAVLEQPGAGSYLVRVAGEGPRDGNVYRIEISDKKPEGQSGDQQQQQDPDEGEDQPKQDENQEQEQEQEQKQEQKEEEEEQQQQQQQQIESLLENLEDDDRNRALERALQAAPQRGARKPW